MEAWKDVAVIKFKLKDAWKKARARLNLREERVSKSLEEEELDAPYRRRRPPV